MGQWPQQSQQLTLKGVNTLLLLLIKELCWIIISYNVWTIEHWINNFFYIQLMENNNKNFKDCHTLNAISTPIQKAQITWRQYSVLPFGIVAIKNIFVHWQLQIGYFFAHPSSQTATNWWNSGSLYLSLTPKFKT